MDTAIATKSMDDVLERFGLRATGWADDGWADSLERMFVELRLLGWCQANHPLRVVDQGTCLEVKGRLNPAWANVVDVTESVSRHTCRVCGGYGEEVVCGMFVRTLCPRDSAELGFLNPRGRWA